MAAEIGIGLAALGRPGYINLGHAKDLCADYSVAAMRSHTFEVLDAAWDHGIRYFDAARSYGRAEEFLAQWLRYRAIGVNQVRVGSKWGYTYTADWAVKTPTGIAHEVKEHSAAMLEKQYAISRRWLGKHLNLYQIHSATTQSAVLENVSVIDRLSELRESGIEIGLSVSGVQQAEVIEKAITVERYGKPLFSSVQATWNLLERSAETALAHAHAAGMKVIVKESLANGRLTPRNQSTETSSILTPLNIAAEELEAGWDAVAIAAAMNQPWATTVLSGAASVDHVSSNVKARQIVWNAGLDQDLLTISQPAQDYWQQRSNLNWN